VGREALSSAVKIVKTRHRLNEPQTQPNHGGVETWGLAPPENGAELLSASYVDASNGHAPQDRNEYVNVLWLVR
jgi:hypothetical protein